MHPPISQSHGVISGGTSRGLGVCVSPSLPSYFISKPWTSWHGQGEMGRQAEGSNSKTSSSQIGRVARVPVLWKAQHARGAGQKLPAYPKMWPPPGWDRAVTEPRGV